MKTTKIYLTLFLALFFLSACHKDEEQFPEKTSGISIAFSPLQSLESIGDSDDLPEEYAIKNLSVFLANPGSNIVSNSFIHQGFSSINDSCTLINLPLDPSTVTFKDIYVIVNCNDIASLTAIGTVNDIKALKTPEAPITSLVMLSSGLPMYGQAANVNLSNTSAGNPANVTLTRTCAKLRVTLDNEKAGTDNAFIVENTAPYTFYALNDPITFNSSDLVAYPQVPLNLTTAGNYQGITYVYESTQLPRLRIFTSIDGVSKEYVASSNFPLPVRGHLYDIHIQILSSGLSSALKFVEGMKTIHSISYSY